MRNGKAFGAVFLGLLALGVLGGGIWAIVVGEIRLVGAVAALPVSALLASSRFRSAAMRGRRINVRSDRSEARRRHGSAGSWQGSRCSWL